MKASYSDFAQLAEGGGTRHYMTVPTPRDVFRGFLATTYLRVLPVALLVPCCVTFTQMPLLFNFGIDLMCS